jgi:phage gpG-like protein
VASSTVVRVEGAKNLRRTLRKAGKDLSELKAAHKEAANIAAAAGRGKAPNVSGALAATVRGSGTNTAAIVRAGRASVPYAQVIHWGWPGHNIAANPFLTEAAQETEPTWFAVYTEAFDNALNQIKGI